MEYLLKFVSNDNHAESLLDGKLFTRPACYYHDLENKLQNGQRDIHEATMVTGQMFYWHTHYPIFCTYLVPDIDTDDHSIRFSVNMVQQFGAQYVVVLPFGEFRNRLSTIKNNQYAIRGDIVRYGDPTMELSIAMMLDDYPSNLFIKRTMFSYQNEYRFVVCESIKTQFKVYELEKDLRDIADKYEISRLERQGGFYQINFDKWENNAI